MEETLLQPCGRKVKTGVGQLLILSKDHISYEKLINQAGLPGLSILSTDNPIGAIEIGGECEVIFGEPSLIAQVINQLPQVRWIQSTWAGVEPLLADGMRRDYLLTNARNVYGGIMSEYVFAYLLMIERNIISRWQDQLERKWNSYPSGSLKGKLMGIMGVGTIGAALAATANHFGMRVHGYTLGSEDCTNVIKYFHVGEEIDFARDLDYLVCTLPGTPATKGIINHRLLAALPQKAWLVNIGRGSAVDEYALIEALNNGSLSGAVLDVVEQEPLPPEHPLWNTPNTYITAHSAAKNYPPDIAAIFIENYRRWIDGLPVLYKVDFDKQY